MSWPDMMTPWETEPPRLLRLRDYLTRGGRFCADCLKAGARCPDHTAPGTEAAS